MTWDIVTWAAINRDRDWPLENTALVETPTDALLDTAWSLENAVVVFMAAAIVRYLETSMPAETASDIPAEIVT